MKLKKNNIKKLQRNIHELNLDLKAIIEEHNKYDFGDIEKLPIETLSESVEVEHGKPRNTPSLNDMKHRDGLRKLYYKKQEELEFKEHQLNIAKIDLVLKDIKKIESKILANKNNV